MENLPLEPSNTEARELREVLAQEQTAWKRAPLNLAVQYTVTRVLAEAATLQEALPKILQTICGCLDWDLGALWQPQPERNSLRCVEIWSNPSLNARDFEKVCREMTFAAGVGLPGRVWANGQAATILEAPKDPNFPRASIAARVGLLGAFAFPIQAGCAMLGVMEFFSRSAQVLDDELLTLMAILGGQIGQFIERTRSEEALRESEARYRVVVETASDAIFTIRQDSTIVFANPGAEKLFGYSREELIGCSLTKLMPEYLRHIHSAGLKRYIDTGRKHISWQGVELPGLHKSGREIPVEISFGELQSGGQHLFTGFVRDISERKSTEQTRSWLAAIVENSEDAIIGKTLDGVITSWNKGAENLYGYGAEEAIGQSISMLIPPDRFDELSDILKRINHGEAVERYETTRARKDGRRIDVSLTISPIKDPSGKLCGASTIARDITQRCRAQRDLEESERQYRLLFDNNPQPMWVYDCETLAFLAINNAAIRNYGYTREEFLSMTLRNIRPADDIPGLLEDIRQANATLHTDGPWRHKRKDGTVLVVEITAHPIQFGDRDARFVMATDITERKKLEEQFQHSQRLESIGRLAGGVAHDFNNLLTVINGYADMGAEDLPVDHPLHQTLKEIHNAGERAAALTKQLLAFSRKQLLQPTVLNLNHVVVDIAKMLERLIGEHIKLVTKLEPKLANLTADAGQLQQVIINLAVNSRDAMPRGGTLIIETANVELDADYTAKHPQVQPGRYILLAVTDNGEGMTPEVQKHIFDPFFTTKPTGAGTGLGLATVHGIVKQTGGWIWVYSEPGRGTSFKLYFPRTDASVSAVSTVLKANLRGTEAILIVEDQEDVRTLAIVALRRYGYTVYNAASASEARAFVQGNAGPLDLLLTDVVMPGGNGHELAAELRKLRPELKVLFMSGYTDNAIVHHGILNHDVQYLQKPFTADILAEKVREALGSELPKATILLADDSDGVRTLFRHYLVNDGYAVIEATSGRQAVEQVAAGFHIDVVILDMVMPDLEGTQTIRLIHEKIPNLKVIAISGASGVDAITAAPDLGAITALRKPIQEEELLAAVRDVLRA